MGAGFGGKRSLFFNKQTGNRLKAKIFFKSRERFSN
jgi:hypothetical protein